MKLDDAAGIGDRRGIPGVGGPVRLTAAEWRAWGKAQRTWRRRVVSSVVLVVAVEAMAAVAYQRLLSALDTPAPPTPA